MNDELKLTLDSKWAEIEKQIDSRPYVVWQYHIAPPIPSHWEIRTTDSLYFYVFAMTSDFMGGLVDGVYVAAPWARIERPILNLGSANITTLTDAPRKLGIQGERPLEQEEIDCFSRDVVRDFVTVAEMPHLANENLAGIRAYYKSWLNTNGVIAREIEKQHAEFFRWVEF